VSPHRRAQGLGDGLERQCLGAGGAESQQQQGLALKPGSEFVDQARLAYARLAQEEEGLPLARLGACVRLLHLA